jgi:DNA-binding MarR family transcriptional regulator
MDERSETRATAQRIARECVGARIRMLNRKISRIYDEAVRPHGIKFSQMNILTMVALNEPVAPVDLVRVLELEKSTLSRNVALMEANGWIESLAGGGNRQLLRTTREGRRLLKRAAPDWKDAQARVESMLGRAVAQQIRTAANQLATQDS